MDFNVRMCETSEVSAVLSCLVFPREFSGSELPVNNPNLIYLLNIICSTGKPLASKSLCFPKLGHTICPGCAAPSPALRLSTAGRSAPPAAG